MELSTDCFLLLQKGHLSAEQWEEYNPLNALYSSPSQQARFYGGAKHPQMKSIAPSVKALILAFFADLENIQVPKAIKNFPGLFSIIKLTCFLLSLSI